MSLDVQDIYHAYAAGIFDGEGCIHAGVSRSNPTGRPRPFVKAVMAMSDPRPLRLMQTLFGGSIRTGAAKGMSKKTFWFWELGTKATSQFLADVLPYLIVKKDQAQLALQLHSRSSATRQWRTDSEEIGIRLELVKKIKDLKHQEIA